MDMPVILIIEDERAIFLALSLLLQSAGYRVVHAPDSACALVWLASHTPALVLLDLWIPMGGGRRLAHEIRGRYGSEVPIIAMTAEYLSADMITTIGAVGYLRKPFDLDEVLACVERVLPIEYSGTQAYC